MFGSLGLPEILFILVLALLVFGPRRLPEVGRTIGRALGEFRRATGDLKRSFDQEMTSFEKDASAVVPAAGHTPRVVEPEDQPPEDQLPEEQLPEDQPPEDLETAEGAQAGSEAVAEGGADPAEEPGSDSKASEAP